MSGSKRAFQRLKVWYYLKAMNRCYAQATWYEEHGYRAQAMSAWLEGDEYRAKWMQAQGAHRHPSYQSKYNDWVDQLHDGDYTNYDD